MGSSATTVMTAMSGLPDLLLLRPRSAALSSPLPPSSPSLPSSSPSPSAFSPSSSSSSSSSAVAAAAAAFAVGRLLGSRGSRGGSRLPSISWRGGGSISSPSSPSPSPFPLVSAAAVDRSSRNAALCSRGAPVSSPCFQRASPVSTRSGTHRTFATMSSELPESPANNPGLRDGPPDEATKGYFFQQTMYRIKDPKVSLDFYTRILGMSLLKKFDFPEAKFSLFFLGYEDPSAAPTDPKERTAWTFSKKATLELTHNWGTESDENFKGHHNGNSEPKGYGHIGVTVDDTYKACERFEKLGVKFVKKPDDGRMKGIAFIQDPDGYWIELFDTKSMKSIS